jgi:hypothetical protein
MVDGGVDRVVEEIRTEMAHLFLISHLQMTDFSFLSIRSLILWLASVYGFVWSYSFL